MRRLMWLTAGVALAAVPAVFGLTDNPALSHSVPVRIPSRAVPATDTHINVDGQVRHDGNEGSGKDGHGDLATPHVSGKDSHGDLATPHVSGKDGHGATVTPHVSGKDGRGATVTPHVSGKDGDGHLATPHVSGKDGHGATATPRVPTATPPVATATPGVPGKNGHGAGADRATIAPTASPTSGKADISPAAPDQRVRRPDATRRVGSGNHGLDDGLSQGGGDGRKLPF